MLCEEMGSRLSHNELETALILLDQNGDGQIDWNEFRDWWMIRKTDELTSDIA